MDDAIAPADTPMKTCRDCHTALPITRFGLSKAFGDGRHSRCPPCLKTANQENEERRRTAPFAPLRYYVDSRGKMRCLACDGYAYKDDLEDHYCWSCGIYLDPPRRRVRPLRGARPTYARRIFRYGPPLRSHLSRMHRCSGATYRRRRLDARRTTARAQGR